MLVSMVKISKYVNFIPYVSGAPILPLKLYVNAIQSFQSFPVHYLFNQFNITAIENPNLFIQLKCQLLTFIAKCAISQ